MKGYHVDVSGRYPGMQKGLKDGHTLWYTTQVASEDAPLTWTEYIAEGAESQESEYTVYEINIPSVLTTTALDNTDPSKILVLNKENIRKFANKYRDVMQRGSVSPLLNRLSTHYAGIDVNDTEINRYKAAKYINREMPSGVLWRFSGITAKPLKDWVNRKLYENQ